ncbi:NUDIX domain-containing protein, partial [Prochlorococcus sp. AH-716-J09]|nr:NUDIX domain-containing protein [Prochlorococcus sp. AH-716-J09]
VTTIDLCIVRNKKILLGKRRNNPAKDFYFVPGGRIMKGETIDNALTRIIKVETGISISRKENKKTNFLGVFEHFYEENFLGNKEFSSQYIVLAYLLDANSLSTINHDIFMHQHSDLIWYDITRKKIDINIHEYSTNYINLITKILK